MSGKAKPFEKGETLYNRDGRKLYFRRDLGDGTAIVSRWLTTDTWDGEQEDYVSDEPIIVSMSGLFNAPPVEAVSAEVRELEARLKTVREALSLVESQSREAEAERTRVIAALREIEPLRQIERFIAGEITHFLIVRESYGQEFYGGVSIETFEKAITKLGDYGRAEGMKLLSLFGDSKKNLTFRINQYGDGSGSYRSVMPFLSYEDAHAKAAELLASVWSSTELSKNDYRLAEAIKSAADLGLPVPDDVREAYNKKVRDAKTAAVSKAREALEKAEAELSGATL